MKTIHTIADIEELIEMGSIPLEYVSAIESELSVWFEAEGTGESLMAFGLSDHACISPGRPKRYCQILNQRAVIQLGCLLRGT
ncbi:hypothetical protein ACIQYS_12730 [Psychrobacillus sp. NPDC096426]|uniref:hypothetical protein n=1 Tax=Psychrobacillus sp. NPDC096426 TaxID=3364491 RepID=UPI003820C93F